MKKMMGLLLAVLLVLMLVYGTVAAQAGVQKSGGATPAAVHVDDIITFGHYEQDNDLSNGKEPIEWIVIKTDPANNRVLLLSRYGLDNHRFDAGEYQGWEKSEIRQWLNSTFLNNAFTPQEQAAIEITTVKTGDNAEWISLLDVEGWGECEYFQGGADTQDQLFLLSLEEIAAYAGYSNLADFYYNAPDKVRTTATPYAVAQGAYQAIDDIDEENCIEFCWWWLRSPGTFSDSPSFVFENNVLIDYDFVNLEGGSVRPACWIDLTSANIQ